MYQIGAVLLAYHKVYFIERDNLNQKGIDENNFLCTNNLCVAFVL